MVKKVELTGNNLKYYNTLYNGMKIQVKTIENFYNENTDSILENLNIIKFTDVLNEKIEQVILELNDIVFSSFLSAKKEFLDSIKRDMVLRKSDEIDRKILEHYNALNVKRLANDVQEKLFQDIVSEKSENFFKDFLEEAKLRGNQTSENRMILITNDVIKRSSTTGQIQGMRDFGFTRVFVRPHSGGDVCNLCMEEYEKNPHYINTIEKKYPMHPNCLCTLKKVFLEKPTDDPVSQMRYTNLVHYYSENS